MNMSTHICLAWSLRGHPVKKRKVTMLNAHINTKEFNCVRDWNSVATPFGKNRNIMQSFSYLFSLWSWCVRSYLYTVSVLIIASSGFRGNALNWEWRNFVSSKMRAAERGSIAKIVRSTLHIFSITESIQPQIGEKEGHCIFCNMLQCEDANITTFRQPYIYFTVACASRARPIASSSLCVCLYVPTPLPSPDVRQSASEGELCVCVYLCQKQQARERERERHCWLIQSLGVCVYEFMWINLIKISVSESVLECKLEPAIIWVRATERSYPSWGGLCGLLRESTRFIGSTCECGSRCVGQFEFEPVFEHLHSVENDTKFICKKRIQRSAG